MVLGTRDAKIKGRVLLKELNFSGKDGQVNWLRDKYKASTTVLWEQKVERGALTNVKLDTTGVFQGFVLCDTLLSLHWSVHLPAKVQLPRRGLPILHFPGSKLNYYYT